MMKTYLPYYFRKIGIAFVIIAFGLSFYANINEVRTNDPRDSYIFNPNTHVRNGIFNLVSAEYGHRLDESSGLTFSFLLEKSDLWSDLINRDISHMEGNYNDTLPFYRPYKQAP